MKVDTVAGTPMHLKEAGIYDADNLIYLMMLYEFSCNANCLKCSSGESISQNINPLKSNTVLSLDDRIRIVDICAESGARELVLSGLGEPIIHPHSRRLIEHAKQVGLHIVLYT